MFSFKSLQEWFLGHIYYVFIFFFVVAQVCLVILVYGVKTVDTLLPPFGHPLYVIYWIVVLFSAIKRMRYRKIYKRWIMSYLPLLSSLVLSMLVHIWYTTMPIIDSTGETIMMHISSSSPLRLFTIILSMGCFLYLAEWLVYHGIEHDRDDDHRLVSHTLNKERVGSAHTTFKQPE